MLDALRLLDDFGDDGAFYMGGTELLLLMKLGFAQPKNLVDGKQIHELNELVVTDNELIIGAGVTHRRLERHPDIRRLFPALAKLEALVANVRVRNVGTLGGNLSFAEPHSDPLTLLMAMGASVRLASLGGEREILLDEFCRGAFSTVLVPGEIMTSIALPLPPAGTRVGYQRLALKERPTVTAAVVSGRNECRVWVGAITGKPFRMPRAEEALVRSGSDGLSEAIRMVEEESVAHVLGEGSEFQAHLAGVLVGRAWSAANSRPQRRSTV